MAKKETTREVSKQSQAPTTSVSRGLSPFEEMDRVFESLFPAAWRHPFMQEWPSWSRMAAPLEGRMPKVDVIDRDKEVLVRAQVAGVKKEDLDVTLSDNTVTIKGCTSHEDKEEKGDYYRCEISRGEFSRTVALPADVDTEAAKASFDNGVLELTLPKAAKAKRRTVKVE
jgi:HSP20 family protein